MTTDKEKLQKQEKKDAREQKVGYTDIDRLMSEGAFEKWTSEQRAQYILDLCEAHGLDPRTQPIRWLVLDGRLVPYLQAGGTDQLRRINNLSTEIIEEGFFKQPNLKGELVYSGTYYVKLKVFHKESGREQIGVGATAVGYADAGKGMSGDSLANAVMKTFTKAQRRGTIQYCGLGMLDESELESIPRARIVDDTAVTLPAKAAPARLSAPTPSTTLQNAPGQAIPSFHESTPQPAKQAVPAASQASTTTVAPQPQSTQHPVQAPKPTIQPMVFNAPKPGSTLKPPLPPMKPPIIKPKS